MKSSILITALAGVALAATTPALAQGRGGGQGGGHSGGMGGSMGIPGGMGGGMGSGRMDTQTGVMTRTEARQNSRGPDRASDQGRDRANRNSVLSGSTSTRGVATRDGRTDVGVTTRTQARQNSRGAANASATAITRANQNSVLSGTTTGGTALSNLRTGLMVHDTTGAMLGTISRINRSSDGTVRNVLVTTSSGQRQVLTLAPNTLSLNGNVVTTTRLATSSRRR